MGFAYYPIPVLSSNKGEGVIPREPKYKVLLVAATVILVASVSTAQAKSKSISAADHANIITATWQCQDRIPTARTKNHYYPWKPHSQSFRADQVNKWRSRYNACHDYLKERARQWNWQAFPSWIIRLAKCESGINWYAEGSSSDGVFYSAFNISRSQYDKDAHHMGVRGWHEGPGIPSPYEQAMAVIGHMRLLGDGFTGRCHGIARSSWN